VLVLGVFPAGASNAAGSRGEFLANEVADAECCLDMALQTQDQSL
jgi:hypothetical protein